MSKFLNPTLVNKKTNMHVNILCNGAVQLKLCQMLSNIETEIRSLQIFV